MNNDDQQETSSADEIRKLLSKATGVWTAPAVDVDPPTCDLGMPLRLGRGLLYTETGLPIQFTNGDRAWLRCVKENEHCVTLSLEEWSPCDSDNDEPGDETTLLGLTARTGDGVLTLGVASTGSVLLELPKQALENGSGLVLAAMMGSKDLRGGTTTRAVVGACGLRPALLAAGGSAPSSELGLLTIDGRELVVKRAAPGWLQVDLDGDDDWVLTGLRATVLDARDGSLIMSLGFAKTGSRCLFEDPEIALDAYTTVELPLRRMMGNGAE